MLLAHLREQHGVRGYGMEIDPQNVANCIAAGVNVIQGDIDAGLTDFETASFDHVVMTQEIGRASCRERVCQYVSISVFAVSLKKKQHNQNMLKRQVI